MSNRINDDELAGETNEEILMEEKMIALHFKNNELAAISEAISECKKILDSSRDLTDFNNAENKINDALYNLILSEMEEEGSGQ